MDNLMLIRAGIFFVAGVVSISFQERLNKFKNNMLKRLHMKNRIKDERKAYFYTGSIFIIISIVLLAYAITH
jgi:multidrug transporter EmrE-like cation transporter